MGQIEDIAGKATTVVAGGGIAMPVWMPVLERVSQIAAALVPILSALWLAVQIWRFIFGRRARSFVRDEGGAARKLVMATAMIGAVMSAAVPLVTKWEGVVLHPYPDVIGKLTWCIGETQGTPKASYTPQECADQLNDRLLNDYYLPLIDCAPELAGAPIEVQAATVSWAYNVGVGAACGSTLMRHIRASDWRAACEQLPRWNKAGGHVWQGLINRRTDERGLCLSGL